MSRKVVRKYNTGDSVVLCYDQVTRGAKTDVYSGRRMCKSYELEAIRSGGSTKREKIDQAHC